MRFALVCLLAAALSACAARKPPPSPPPPPPDPAATLVEQAQALTAAGKPRDAFDVYLKVLRDYPNDPAAADARYGMGMLRVDPNSPLLDYRAALINFDRLLTRHGTSAGPWLKEAESWRAVLRRMQRCESKGAKLEADLDQLKDIEDDIDRLRERETDLERLRELDMKLEQQP